MKTGKIIYKVGLPIPYREAFDYLAPLDSSLDLPLFSRVTVPMGKRRLPGIVLTCCSSSSIPDHKLKPIHATHDQKAILPPDLLTLLEWASDYYHYPLGATMLEALPSLIRQGQADQPLTDQTYTTTDQAPCLTTPPSNQEQRLLTALSTHQSLDDLIQQGHKKTTLQRLIKKQWVTTKSHRIPTPTDCSMHSPLTPNVTQTKIIQHITQSSGFQTHLLHGVTGSGKTEVYFHCIASCLAKQQQALVLVPEISLTPQLIERFKQRFNVPIYISHSGLSDKQRAQTWLAAKYHQAAIVIGTRSAVFTPLHKPGLIVVDEEHDTSFKQQSQFRYHARDLAVMRAKLNQIPIILGSATPSLNSLLNANKTRYQLHQLHTRAGGASLPSFQVISTHQQQTDAGICQQSMQHIENHLAKQQQVLIFINRRGFAPIYICKHCGYMADCQHCDAHLTYHQHKHKLICHHCQRQTAPDHHCPKCQQTVLSTLGVGTEQIESRLTDQFAGCPIIRVDKDTTKNKKDFVNLKKQIETTPRAILIGTQMLAKGHHFPNVSLVIIIDADQGLMSTDFFAAEKTAQLITQVAGRAGRATTPGHVVIQTSQPQHPLFSTLPNGNYLDTASALMADRQQHQLPPFQALAIIAVESKQPQAGIQRLSQVKKHITDPSIQVLGPMPAILKRKDNWHRHLICLMTTEKTRLSHTIKKISSHLEEHHHHTIRWTIDVDPGQLF